MGRTRMVVGVLALAAMIFASPDLFASPGGSQIFDGVCEIPPIGPFPGDRGRPYSVLCQIDESPEAWPNDGSRRRRVTVRVMTVLHSEEQVVVAPRKTEEAKPENLTFPSVSIR